MSLALTLGAVVVLLLAGGPVRPPWRSQGPQLTTAVMTVAGVALAVEVADEPAERSRGLGYRAGLEPGKGMLFVYESPSEQSFWMKGMRFCLDIVWIEGGHVVGVAESICPAPPGTPDAEIPRALSPIPVRYVLEVPAGWMAAHGLGTGSSVSISLENDASS